MPLPLYGTVDQQQKDEGSAQRRILRLRTPQCTPERDEDAALVRSPVELRLAAGRGFSQAFIIGEDPSGNEDALGAFDRVYRLPRQFGYLGDEDVVSIDPASGAFRVHYRRSSAHNSFLVTERCNHYCLMCSQPPRRVDDGWILDEIRACLPLISKDTGSLGFTGGEPLLDWQGFIEVLAQCRDELPKTAVHVLSNGRAFANRHVVDAWADLKHPDLMVGIPVYAAVDHVHDYVVQARGAFDETLLGILKLKDLGCRVEIRVVIHAITAKHLVETCRWLARNLPFVDHVALMGLEDTGFAIANDKLLWIDPVDYQGELALGVGMLNAAGVRVSVYNLPLCLLAPSVRPFAVQSISDWKNGYHSECEVCDERANCGGFFTSGRPKRSRAIRAIRNAPPGLATREASAT